MTEEQIDEEVLNRILPILKNTNPHLNHDQLIGLARKMLAPHPSFSELNEDKALAEMLEENSEAKETDKQDAEKS